MRKGYRKNTMLGSMVMQTAKNTDRVIAHSKRSSKKTKYSAEQETGETSKQTVIAFCVFAVFALSGVIVAFSHYDFIKGIMYGLILWGVGFVAAILTAIILSLISSSEAKVDEVQNMITYDERYNGMIDTMVSLVKNRAENTEIDKVLDGIDESARARIIYKSLDAILKDINQHLDDWDEALVSYMNGIIDTYEVPEYKNQTDKEYFSYLQNCTLFKLLNGIMPDNTITGVNINWQVNEQFIWAFRDVVLYQEETQTIRVGKTAGFGVKIAKGLYYRTGGFESYPVTQTQMKAKQIGYLIITNKNVYFYSINKSNRYPYSKILAYVPFSDAIGIQLDKENAKTMFFGNIDGTFAYNLFLNIKNIE